MPDLTIKSVPRSITKASAAGAARALGFDPSQVRTLAIDMPGKTVRAELLVLDKDEHGLLDSNEEPVVFQLDIKIKP